MWWTYVGTWTVESDILIENESIRHQTSYCEIYSTIAASQGFITGDAITDLCQTVIYSA